MVRHFNWRDPSMLRKISKRLTIATCLVIALIIYLQQDVILRLITSLFP